MKRDLRIELFKDLKRFDTLDKAMFYLQNYQVAQKYKRLKIKLIIYSNNSILESLMLSTMRKSVAGEVIKNNLTALYGDHLSSYEIIIFGKNNKNAEVKYDLLLQDLNDENLKNKLIDKRISAVCDLEAFQNYLNKELARDKQSVLLFAKEDDIARFYEIVKGVLTNFIMVDLKTDLGKMLYNKMIGNFDKRYDEIIVDTLYKEYLEICEKYKTLNIAYIDYRDKLRYFDEKKVIAF